MIEAHAVRHSDGTVQRVVLLDGEDPEASGVSLTLDEARALIEEIEEALDAHEPWRG